MAFIKTRIGTAGIDLDQLCLKPDMCDVGTERLTDEIRPGADAFEYAAGQRLARAAMGGETVNRAAAG